MRRNTVTNHDEIPQVPQLQRRSSFSDIDNEDESQKNSIELVEPSKDKPKEPVTLKKVFTRSATAIVAFSLYLALLSAGHLYCIIAVMLVQVRIILLYLFTIA